MQKSLKNLSYEAIQQWALDQGFAAYTGRQLFEWLFRHNLADVQEMHNINKKARARIAAYGPLRLLQCLRHESSTADKTDKFLFKCLDGNAVESVVLRAGKRVTLCLSSQVGCAMGCSFCRTADMGLKRNLGNGEIIEQFFLVSSLLKEKITNIVFMGMGEPFHNYESCLAAAIVLNHQRGAQIGARHITFSTCGIVPRIRDFVHLPYAFKLAISLNAATNSLRDSLMPINKRYPLQQLLQAAKYYSDNTGRRITFEYVLIRDVNNSARDAEKIKEILRNIPCKLNVIPYNESGSSYRCPNEQEIEAFLQDLHDAPFPVILRKSGGPEIKAACGQLYHEVIKP